MSRAYARAVFVVASVAAGCTSGTTSIGMSDPMAGGGLSATGGAVSGPTGKGGAAAAGSTSGSGGLGGASGSAGSAAAAGALGGAAGGVGGTLAAGSGGTGATAGFAGTSGGNGMSGSGGSSAGTGGIGGAVGGASGVGGSTAGGGGASAGAGPTGGAAGSTGTCACAPATNLIYVLANPLDLWSFDPLTYSFAHVGKPDCGLSLVNTYSMSVDRSGRAWILFKTNEMRLVDVNAPSAGCVDPGYAWPQMGFQKFGMGFSSNTVSDPCDQLYMFSCDNTKPVGAGKLGRLDPATLKVSKVADVGYNCGELAGTGDGRLFAVPESDPARLVEYDKWTGTVLKTTVLPGLSALGSFAFAFARGSFYLFTVGAKGATKVTEVNGTTYAMKTVVPVAPILVVGAGSSTCAPLAP